MIAMSPKRLLVLVGVAATLLAVGLAVTRQGPEPIPTLAAPSQPVPTSEQVPPTETPDAGSVEAAAPALVDARDAPEVAIALGAERTEQGARDAAVAILELTEEAVTMSPADAAAFQRPFSTEDFADEAAARTEGQMVELHRTIPEGVTLRLAPIAVRSDPDGADWVVSIWFVEAITIGTEAVVDDWRTATYTMRWEDDAWKVAAFDSIRGPMPGRGTQPASAPPLQFEALLAGFTDVGLN